MFLTQIMTGSSNLIAATCAAAVTCLKGGGPASACNALCSSSSGGSSGSLFGKIVAPPGVANFGGGGPEGLAEFLNVLLKYLVVGAGVYAMFNLVIAGYAFMSAGDDAKKVAGAWQKIWQTMMGLAFTAGAYTLAAIFGKLIFGDYNAILQLKYFTQ